jgi:hypothetical protein
MKRTILYSLSLLIAAAFCFSYDVPKNWRIAGSQPDKYEMGIDKGAGQNGKNVATIRSVKRKIKGFGTLMQTCLAEKYAGKRVRMTGYIRSEGISVNDRNNWAGLWFRVDPVDVKKTRRSLAFDNMYDRAVKGNTDWTKYEIVLDVPKEAYKLAYGALLSGTGQIWFDNISFEIVDNSVPSTSISPLTEPQNLNFEK